MLAFKSRNRGSILIVACLFTFLALLLAFTLFKVLPMEYHVAQESRLDISAHYAADAGVKEAILWIEDQPHGTIFSSTYLDGFNTEFGEIQRLDDDWTYRVRLELIEPGHYGVTSEAFFRERKIREVKAQLLKRPFSYFGFFIDHWRFENRDDPVVYFLGERLVNGPFHTNDFFVLAHKTDEAFADGGEPFVAGPYAQMTHSVQTDVLGSGLENFVHDGNAYLGFSDIQSRNFNASPGVVPFGAGGPLEDRYQRIVEGGKANLNVVGTVNFPDIARDRDGVELREKARGFQVFEGSVEEGVYLSKDSSEQINGGVYVVGNSEIELRLDPNQNQIQRVSQVHKERVYYRSELKEVTHYPLVQREHEDTPETVEEVREVEVMRREIVGYEESEIVVGDGITEIGRIPIYELVPETHFEVVEVPYDPEVHGEGPFYYYEQDLENPITYNTYDLVEIDPEDYDPQEPTHTYQLQEAGERIYDVIEVSEDAGYQVPSGLPQAGTLVQKDHTVLIDHRAGTVEITPGNLNGVTFVDGHIDALSGINKGAIVNTEDGHGPAGRTIVAAPEHGRQVNITGHLYQFYNGGGALQGPANTLLPGQLAPNAHHALGLIGHDVNMNIDFRTTEDGPLYIYAVVMAGSGEFNPNGEPIEGNEGRQISTGGFGTHEDMLQNRRLPLGQFNLYGGIITANARSWFEGDVNGRARGLAGNLTYDPAAAIDLRDFPSTDSVRLARYSEYADFE